MPDKTDESQMRIMVLGDIVGRPGRHAFTRAMDELRKKWKFDMLIANAENCAGGKGITPDTLQQLFEAGIDALTTGDHVFQQRTAEKALQDVRVVRPLNYPPGAPGSGCTVITVPESPPVGIANVLGRVFMKPVDCPFRAIDDAITVMHAHTNIIIVDIHAEATSEKIAFGRYCDGRVSAVCGTHTHVQTADECILPKGTAYITDLGMCGAHDSVLGRDVESVLKHFVSGLPHRFAVAKEDVRLNGVLITISKETGHALEIQRVSHVV
jgi:2',3'-cyclic-nucleotide 2'-phosphodiesterase